MADQTQPETVEMRLQRCNPHALIARVEQLDADGNPDTFESVLSDAMLGVCADRLATKDFNRVNRELKRYLKAEDSQIRAKETRIRATEKQLRAEEKALREQLRRKPPSPKKV